MKIGLHHLWSIQTKITLFALAIFAACIWLLAYYARGMLRADMQRLSAEQQMSTVSIVAGNIDRDLGLRLGALEREATRISPALLHNPAALQAFLEDHQSFDVLFNAGSYVTGLDGTAIASIPLSAGRKGVNYSDRNHVASALREGRSRISEVVIGKRLKAPVFAIAAPVHGDHGKVIGALVGVINLSSPSFLDILMHSSYGETGGYLLVDPRQRQIVTATDKRRVMETLPAPGLSPIVDRFVGGYEGSAIAIDLPSGVEMLTSAKGIPLTGWYLAVVLPTEEAFSPIRDMQRRILLAAIFLTLAVACLTWLMLRRQLSPMLATVTTLAGMLESEGPHAPLPIARQDEIGQLIGGFNRLLGMMGQREEALRESELRFRALVETVPLAIYLTSGPERATQYMNPTMVRMFGYAPEDIPSLEVWMLRAHPDEVYRRAVAEEWRKREGQAMDSRLSVEPLEVVVTCRDGSKKDIEWDFIVLGGRRYYCGLDLTERKNAEEKKRLLSEKETMLKEVHHRIKNNMGTIKSLLQLQAKSLKEPTAILALEDASSRVQSMMVLYDSLYQETSFRELSLLHYFPPLIDMIVANFPNSASVRVEKRIDDFVLDAKRLQVLGIIINELLTNSMKYSFVGGAEGLICVSARLAGTRVTFEIQDDGVGIPESVDFENSSGFGLSLVRILTLQLEGSIRLERGRGTRIVLEFDR
jgi:PAS domain S-box-containing protein